MCCSSLTQCGAPGGRDHKTTPPQVVLVVEDADSRGGNLGHSHHKTTAGPANVGVCSNTINVNLYL